VTYGQALATSGAPPVTVMCSPASASVFQPGATVVTCTATDQRQRTASCTFDVTVLRPPRISATRFLAFGDSITAGEINDDSNGHAVARFVDFANSYPTKLQTMLSARYTAQTGIQVLNVGGPGQRAIDDVNRFGAAVAQLPADVVLLQEGINDLNSGGGGAIPGALNALRSMILIARARNMTVFVGTLLPERPSALRAHAAEFVPVFNGQLIPMAEANGAKVVDLYPSFLPNLTTWIGSDGLHPNALGYQQMAQLFFDALKANLEVAAPASLKMFAAPWRR
jgi:lysophospholipase L1-like esterase